MFELEPGPIERLDPARLRPFPPRSSFEGLVADRLGQLAGVDPALSAAAVHVLNSPPDDVDGLYAQTIGIAAVDASAEHAATAASPAPQLVDHGDTTDTMRQAVLGYLPQADTPITAPFVDPPRLGGGTIKAGGWEDTQVTTPPGQIPDLEASVRSSIRYLYFTLLGHGPSQEREDAYTVAVLRDGHTLDWVRADLMSSFEYQQRHGG